MTLVCINVIVLVADFYFYILIYYVAYTMYRLCECVCACVCLCVLLYCYIRLYIHSAVAEWLTAPDTQFLLDFVRPDFLMLRVRICFSLIYKLLVISLYILLQLYGAWYRDMMASLLL